jgi:hypothetical protein
LEQIMGWRSNTKPLFTNEADTDRSSESSGLPRLDDGNDSQDNSSRTDSTLSTKKSTSSKKVASRGASHKGNDRDKTPKASGNVDGKYLTSIPGCCRRYKIRIMKFCNTTYHKHKAFVSERSKELDSSSSSYSAAGVQIPPNAIILIFSIILFLLKGFFTQQ